MKIKDTYIFLLFPSGNKYTWELHAPNGVVLCRACNVFNGPGEARMSINNFITIVRTKMVYVIEESRPEDATKAFNSKST